MTLRLLHYSDLENALDSPDRVARIASYVARERDENTLVVGSGDSLGPSVLSLVTGGSHLLDVYEHLSPVAETVGNHDFDLGIDTLAAVIRASPQTWLTTNVTDASGVLAAAGAQNSTVVDVPAGRIGFVGVITPNLPEMSDQATGIEVTDPTAAVETTVRTLRATDDVDYVVILSHVGNEAELAATLGVSVDAVLGGHSHEALATTVDGTLVGRPTVNGHHLVDVRLGESRSITHLAVEEFNPDPTVRHTLQGTIDEHGLATPVATVTDPLTLDREASALGESRAGNFVTDAIRWAAAADVGLMSARAIRSREPLVGDVTALDLIQIAPFDDELVVLDIPGDRLESVVAELDHSVASTMRDWYFGHVSGATLEWSAHGTLDTILIGGEPVDPSRSYTVATTSYLVETDHIFSSFGPEDVVASRGAFYESLVDFARTDGVNPHLEGRIVRPDQV